MTGGAAARRRATDVPDEPAEPTPAPAEAVIRAVVPVRTDGAPAADRPETSPPPEPPAPPAEERAAAAGTGTAAEAETAAGAVTVAAPAQRRPARRRSPGVRERRRQETRGRIVDAAAELFAERGFDAVSVVEIARRAGVVEKTVFNHFPVKEGLVFEADPPMRAALLEAVRRRPSGTSVAAAAGDFVVSSLALLATPGAAAGLAGMARVVRGSRTLQVREQEILGELTTALTALIAEETAAEPGALEPRVAATAVMGLYSGLLELARDRVLAGASGPVLAAELRERGRRAVALLQFGLAGYAKRR